MLAARGLTDKEIAVKLGISPDTVGTYWRRILAKYQAASRTEVVAKYASERSRAAVDNLQYVNECLKLVADHMIEHVGKPQTTQNVSVGDSILAIAADWIVLLNPAGEIVFSNKPVPDSCRLSSLVQNTDLSDILALAISVETDAELEVLDCGPSLQARSYSFRFTPGVESLAGHIVGVGRSL